MRVYGRLGDEGDILFVCLQYFCLREHINICMCKIFGMGKSSQKPFVNRNH